jgi:predicted oxidoreductase
MNCPTISLRSGGPTLSRVIAGMWRMGEWGMDVTARVRFIEECIDLGVSTFDHADIYGSSTVETLFGEALARHPALKQRIQIVTKCGIQLPAFLNGVHRLKHYDLSAQHILNSVDGSLKKLGVETIDVLLIHRPSPLMDFDEMADTFKRLHVAGKVSHFGVSNFSSAQFDALNKRYPLVTNQVEFSPLHLQPMEDGEFDFLQDHRVSPMIWSALGGGNLFSANSPQLVRINNVLKNAGTSLNLSPAGVVYAWIMRLPCHPLPITGTSRIGVIREAVAATQVNMELEQWFILLEAMRGKEVP